MGRPPRRYSLLFIGPNREPEETLKLLWQLETRSQPAIPECIVEGFLRGLLIYLLAEGKKRRTKRASVEAIVLQLLGYAHGRTATYFYELKNGKNQTDLDSLFRTRATQFVAEVFLDTTRHPSSTVLQLESDLLLQNLKEYATLNKLNQRVTWIESRLPGILRSLRRISLCKHPDCPACIDLPNSYELQRWTTTSHIGKMRHHILAHFHGSTETTTIKILSSNLKTTAL